MTISTPNIALNRQPGASIADVTVPKVRGFRIARFFGIDVRVHWTWLLTLLGAYYMPAHMFRSAYWLLALDLVLFAIVIVHEFGHALACHSVGGEADRILLWPLGGLAFVRPPRRPGAILWTMAAGPLTNVVLLLPTLVLVWIVHRPHASCLDWNAATDLTRFVLFAAVINVVLLVFNLLPIYPLDGGRILQALLWFVIGEGRSLVAVSILGMVGAAAMVILAVWKRDYVLGALVILGFWQCWVGLRRGLRLERLESNSIQFR